MAVNPMQRKARQSFLLGMLLMLVIAAIDKVFDVSSFPLLQNVTTAIFYAPFSATLNAFLASE